MIGKILEESRRNTVSRRIDEICSISRGRVMSKDYIRENAGNYPVFSSQTEHNGELGRISKYDYEGEYLTWTTDGANAGTVFYRNGRFSVTNVCGILKVIVDDVMPKYLYYALSITTPSYVNGGMGNPKLMSNVMSRIVVHVPPLEVQREIVRVLDKFTFLTAELTAELTARKKQYEYYRDQLLSNWIDIQEISILDMLSQPITDGPHETPAFVQNGIPFLSAEAIVDSRLDFKHVRGYITKEYDLACAKKYKPQKGDVYMCKSGSTTGKVAINDTDEDFNIWSPLAAMRVNQNHSAKYLYYLLQSKSVQEQVQMQASHGSQPNLSMRKLEQFKVRVPSKDVQERIVSVLDNFERICNDLNIGLPAEIDARQKQYEYYRDKLLSFKEK